MRGVCQPVSVCVVVLAIVEAWPAVVSAQVSRRAGR